MIPILIELLVTPGAVPPAAGVFDPLLQPANVETVRTVASEIAGHPNDDRKVPPRLHAVDVTGRVSTAEAPTASDDDAVSQY
jgi:hypothetical protein